MGCCGCSPYASTTVAGVLCILHCLSNIPVLVTLLTLITGDGWQNIPWLSPEVILFDKDGLETLTIILVAFNIVWFLTAIWMFYGNSNGNPSPLRLFIGMILDNIAIQIASLIYCSYKASEYMKPITLDDPLWSNKPLLTFLVFGVALSQGGLIWWIIWGFLAYYVHQRRREITAQKKKTKAMAMGIPLSAINVAPGPVMGPPPTGTAYREDWRQPPPDTGRVTGYHAPYGEPIYPRDTPRDVYYRGEDLDPRYHRESIAPSKDPRQYRSHDLEPRYPPRDSRHYRSQELGPHYLRDPIPDRGGMMSRRYSGSEGSLGDARMYPDLERQEYSNPGYYGPRRSPSREQFRRY